MDNNIIESSVINCTEIESFIRECLVPYVSDGDLDAASSDYLINALFNIAQEIHTDNE